jgi:hypothetical protein
MSDSFRLTDSAMVRIPRRTITRASAVQTMVVNSTILAEAIRVANGDPARLEITDQNTIIVWNSREQRNSVVAGRYKAHKAYIDGQYGRKRGQKTQLRTDGEWPVLCRIPKV